MKLSILTCLLTLVVIVNAKLVMIIRHGEKISDDYTDLSPKGKTRAYCLVNNFCPKSNRKKQSTRPKDTVEPLAEALGIQVDLSYTSGQIKKLTNYIISSSDEVTLVSWNNDKIPEIAEKLGITNPPDWDNDTFDEIWMVYDSATTSYYNSNNNSVAKRAVYSGTDGFSMEIVKQNINDCISENFSLFNVASSSSSSSSSQTSSNTSDSSSQKASIYVMEFKG
ncbi:hypothetical protein PIROE2DRAFT_6409 [Piromyces sp. E2]|nr:hypothetical protein PIROE2DRAFT_6409 [Piromyces sp. E2]|eukprot:OUM66365.1 hypothetical protein PIROE2DRAFT_6409 [Piromyces sp. E2]